MGYWVGPFQTATTLSFIYAVLQLVYKDLNEINVFIVWPALFIFFMILKPLSETKERSFQYGRYGKGLENQMGIPEEYRSITSSQETKKYWYHNSLLLFLFASTGILMPVALYGIYKRVNAVVE